MPRPINAMRFMVSMVPIQPQRLRGILIAVLRARGVSLKRTWFVPWGF